MKYSLLIVLVVGMCGCGKPERPSTEEHALEARARVAAHKREDPKGPQKTEGRAGKGLTDEQRAMVVARIGDYEISLGDVERQLASQPAFARARYRSLDKKVEFLNNLVQFELLAREAQKKGYDTDPDVVLAMKRAMIQKFTATDLQKLVTASKITDTDVQRYYDNNKSMFIKPEQIRASHILFEDKASAEKALAEIRAAVVADRSRARVVFSDFARRLTKDRETEHMNGDLNFFSPDGYLDEERRARFRLPKVLVEAAFELKGVNAVSDVVKTDRGFHVLQVTNRRPAVNRTLEDARRQITNILLREKKDSARDSYIQSLRTGAQVTVFEDKLKLLDVNKVSQPGPPPETRPVDPRARPKVILNPSQLTRPARLPKGANQAPQAPKGQEKPHISPPPPRGTK